eukprot:s3000_g1.t1
MSPIAARVATPLITSQALLLVMSHMIKLMKEVCRLRRRYLHPRHVEVCAAHASAHTAAMAAADWAAAERHCQALVDQYVAVYPPWHPITGLQMFTLGELKEQHGKTGEAKRNYQGANKILALTHGADHPLLQQLHERLAELDEGHRG